MFTVLKNDHENLQVLSAQKQSALEPVHIELNINAETTLTLQITLRLQPILERLTFCIKKSVSNYSERYR